MAMSRNPSVSSHSQVVRAAYMSHLEVSIVHNILLGVPCWPRGGVDQSKNLEIWVIGLFYTEEPSHPGQATWCVSHAYHPVIDWFLL